MKKFFYCIFLILTSLVLFHSKIKSQDTSDIISEWLYFRNYQDALYRYISDEALKLLELRRQEVSNLHTCADWQKRQQWIKETLLDIIGPFPEKNDLNPLILKTIKKKKFTVEHIVFESQPGFKVTSSLYIPASLKKNIKAPVIIYCSGHSKEGYRSDVYQHIILNLVNKGFLVFAFDPVGQGERLEYFNPQTGESDIGGSTIEHSYPGAQAFLTGRSQAMHMIWDGIRAVDYLLTRKEVDPKRIGITGRSGGGTQTAYISAIDERIYAAAPECYITNFSRLLQSIGPQDAEQNIFNAIYRGIDHSDFLLVRAPKPSLMICTTNDFFSIQGARETANEVSQIYKVYDKAENFNFIEDIALHESTKKNREAMYAFFQKHLNKPGNSADEEYEMLTSEELLVTETGQISTSSASETIFSLNKKEAEKLYSELQLSRSDIESHLIKVKEYSRVLSGYQDPKGLKENIFTGTIQKDDYQIEKYILHTYNDQIIPYFLYKPQFPNNKALIYLHPEGKKADNISAGEIEWFVRQGYTLLIPDLPGTGETGINNYDPKKINAGDTSYLFWYASILINKSITAIWAESINSICNILKRNKSIYEISAIAKANFVPALLHAAVFNPSIRNIALIEPLSSYFSVVSNRFYSPIFIHSGVAGMLQFYDLPDLAASLAPRNLILIGTVDAKGNSLDDEMLKEELSIVKRAYAITEASEKLKIIKEEKSESLTEIYQDWLD